MNAVTLTSLLVATLIAVAGGAVGAVVGGAKRSLTPLVALAGGAMLAVTLFSILPEAGRHLSLLTLALTTGSGYLFFFLIGKYVCPICPACAVDTQNYDEEGHHECNGHHDERPQGIRNTTLLLSLVLTLHSLVDGFAIASGGHSKLNGDMLPMLLAVGLHKLPEGLALSALLLSSGKRPGPAFLLTLAIEATTLLGGLFGTMALASVPEYYVALMFAHIGGGFLYLVLHGMLGGLLEAPSLAVRRLVPQFGYGSLGFGSVALLLWLLPH